MNFRMVSATALIAVVSLAGCSNRQSVPVDAGTSKSHALVSADPVVRNAESLLTERSWNEFASQTQLEIASCMGDKGFEYVPWVPPESTLGGLQAAFPADFSPVDAVLSVHNAELNDSQRPTNPNQKVIDKLSSAEKANYLAALWEFDGCAESSYQVVNDRWEASFGGSSDSFEEALNQIPLLVSQDGGLNEAEAEFSRCMSASTGLKVRNENEIQAHFEHELWSEADEGTTSGPKDEVIDEVRREEKRVMAAYEDCSQPLIRIRNIVEAAVVNQILREYEPSLEKFANSGQ